jgi:hypothetical protein
MTKYKPGDLLEQEYPRTPTGYYFVVEIVDAEKGKAYRMYDLATESLFTQPVQYVDQFPNMKVH